MKASVEISLYPLNSHYLPAIEAFIVRLNAYPSLMVKTYPTSTLVSGELHDLMQILEKEFEQTWHEMGQSIFVTKWLMGDLHA